MTGKKGGPLLGLPGSIQIAKVMEGRNGPKPAMSARDAIRRMGVDEQIDKPGPNSGMNLTPETEIDDSWAVIPVMAISPYEKNPRKANNAAYAELKQSIREQGILQPLTVTKRPGDAAYMLFAGGNTRLQVLRELWEETGDERFRKTRVIVKTWRGEAAVMLAHMAENTQRNDMTFWDKANGILELKLMLESERGTNLSHRDFESEMRRFGMLVDTRSISMYRYAVESVPVIGPWLTGLAIRRIQPHFNLCVKLCNHFDIEQHAFHQRVVEPVSRDFAEALGEEGGADFSTEAFLEQCNQSLAGMLEVERSTLGKMLAMLEQSKGDVTLDDLLKHTQNKAPASPRPASEGTATTNTKPGKAAPMATQSSALLNKTVPATELPGSREEVEPSPEPVTASPVASSMRRLAERLVVAAEIGSCYQEAPLMPHGFYVGFSPNGPVDLLGEKLDAHSRQIAWWILALASGQFSPEICQKALPPEDEWRQLILGEGQESLQACELSIQHHVGSQGEFMPVEWLFNPANPIADLCLEIFMLSRKGGMKW